MVKTFFVPTQDTTAAEAAIFGETLFNRVDKNVRTMAGKFWSILSDEDVEDLVHDTYLGILENKAKADLSKNFNGWVFRICQNAVNKCARAKSKRNGWLLEIDEDFDDDDEEDKARKASKLSILYKVPYPIVATIAFLAIGLLANGWYWAWTLFMTIPLYYSLLDSIRKKRFTEFAYPVFLAFLYCLLGMLYTWWHPGWLIFVTIPVYYPIAEGIDKYIKNK